VTAAVTALVVFFFHPQLARIRRTVLVLDAAGLGLFTAAGTLKALDFQVPIVGACIIGMMTGIGGGLLRDLLTAQIPLVLRREIYAVASMLAAAVVVIGHHLGVQDLALLVGAAALTFVVRVTAVMRDWSAPVAREQVNRLGCLWPVVSWERFSLKRLREAPPARGLLRVR
jgi:uncharacterized membrane protein YeiH